MFSFYNKLYSPKHLEEIGVDMIYHDKLDDHFLFISNYILDTHSIINITPFSKSIGKPSGFKITVDKKILRDSVYTIILTKEIDTSEFFHKLIDGIINSTNPFLVKNFKYISRDICGSESLEVYDKLCIAPNGHDVLILQSLEKLVKK